MRIKEHSPRSFFMVEANISLLKVLSYEEGEDQDAL
jgi:hypothetical protein